MGGREGPRVAFPMAVPSGSASTCATAHRRSSTSLCVEAYALRSGGPPPRREPHSGPRRVRRRLGECSALLLAIVMVELPFPTTPLPVQGRRDGTDSSIAPRHARSRAHYRHARAFHARHGIARGCAGVNCRCPGARLASGRWIERNESRSSTLNKRVLRSMNGTNR